MPRSCGQCKACCIFTGIEELQKPPNVPCKHLTKVRTTNCCSIYASRPLACRTYACGWLSGLFADHMRPDRAGLLASIYKREDLDPQTEIDPSDVGSALAVTLVITDAKRAGDLQTGALREFIEDLTAHRGVNDIRIVDYTTRNVIHLFEGVIRMGKLANDDPENVEALSFTTFDPPVGTYGTFEPAKLEDVNPKETPDAG